MVTPKFRKTILAHAMNSVSLLRFCGVLFMALSLAPSRAAQNSFESSPLVTPSSVTLVVGETQSFTLADSNGNPATNLECKVDPPIAGVNVEHGVIVVTATKPGRAILTARSEGRSATATLTVSEAKSLAFGAIRWTVAPTPGFETLKAVQAEYGSDSDVAFYSIEWSKSSPALLRAFQSTGQQVWRAKLSTSANPSAFKSTLPVPGETFLNDRRTSLSHVLIGAGTTFVGNGRIDPTPYHLPPDGQTVLLGVSGGSNGGLVLLERGRFHDLLVQISGADGKELWTYRSKGRLTNEWTVNYDGDIGIVETVYSPASSSLLVLSGKTGEVRFQIPFPISSTTIDGFRCQDPVRNVLMNKRPSPAGSVFTARDGNMYLQVETHVESVVLQKCKATNYSFDNSLSLLRVTPEGEAQWKIFQHVHADGAGEFVVQPRLFAGESIPDGFGGVLAAWTYVDPGEKHGRKWHPEARLSRISPSSQRDFVLPMPLWTPGLNSFFCENMVLGEGNPLYATNGQQVIRFDAQAGETNWMRQPPKGGVKIHHATAGGGLLVSNEGQLVLFDSNGNGAAVPWTVMLPGSGNIGLVQKNPFDDAALPPLQLRDMQLTYDRTFLAVEDGAPYGHGSLLSIVVN